MSTRPQEPRIQEDIAAHARRNAMLVQQIIERGGDTQRLRSIDCFFHLRSEDDAIAFSAALQPLALREIGITFSDGAGERRWTVEGAFSSTVAAFTSPERVEELVRIAAEHDAEFDGWGTQLDELPPTI